MRKLDISLGQVVYSKVGRDAGKVLVIVGIIDEQYVLVADGSLRKIGNSKKKKCKHLRFTDSIIGTLEEKLSSQQKVTDAELRKEVSLLERII